MKTQKGLSTLKVAKNSRVSSHKKTSENSDPEEMFKILRNKLKFLWIPEGLSRKLVEEEAVKVCNHSKIAWAHHRQAIFKAFHYEKKKLSQMTPSIANISF